MCACVCVCARMCVCAHACVCARVYVCARVHVHRCVCVHLCVPVCACVHMHVHAHACVSACTPESEETGLNPCAGLTRPVSVAEIALDHTTVGPHGRITVNVLPATAREPVLSISTFLAVPAIEFRWSGSMSSG